MSNDLTDIKIVINGEKDMKDYLLTFTSEYLLTLNGSKRNEVCKDLLEAIKDYPKLKPLPEWEDCVKNPGIWNTLKERKEENV
jgi:hypothetical protein